MAAPSGAARSPLTARALAASSAGLVLLLLLWRTRGDGHSKAAGLAQGAMACPRQLDGWKRMHEELVLETQAADAGEGWEVLFLGDSLTERLRGTLRMGLPCNMARCRGIREVFERHVASRYRTGALGIGGDQTFHLRWRLEHGELPEKPPRLILLLIGTNDVGAVAEHGGAALMAAAERVAERVAGLLSLLRSRLPTSRVALLALLPRGEADPPGLFTQAPACPASKAERLAAAQAEAHRPRMARVSAATYAQPNRYSGALDDANWRLRQLADATPGVAFVDCAGPQLLRPDGSIDPDRMPDALHPNSDGYEAIFQQCWGAAIARLLDAGGGGAAEPGQ